MISLLFFTFLNIIDVIEIGWGWIAVVVIVEVIFSKYRKSKIDKLFQARIIDVYNQLPEDLKEDILLSEVEEVLHTNYYLTAGEVRDILLKNQDDDFTFDE